MDWRLEPDTYADAVVIELLESHGWVRISQSQRKDGRKYFLEKGPDTLIVYSSRERGRTAIRYVWSP